MKPRVTSAVIVKYNNKYLLGKRNKVNMQGLWVFPGGGVDFGETLEQAARREIKEESGLDITNVKLVKHFELINVPGKYHSYVFFHTAESLNDDIKISDDISEAQFFSKEEIQGLNTVQSVKDILNDPDFW